MSEEISLEQILKKLYEGAESWNAWIEACRTEAMNGGSSSFPKLDFSSLSFEKFDFSGYELTRVNFTGAKLRNAYFRYAEISGCVFDGADLRNADMRHHGEGDSSFIAANLSGADLSVSTWQNSNFTNATCLDSDFRSAYLPYSKFDSATLIKSRFSGADLTETSFVDCVLRRAELKAANFTRSNFSRADLSETSLEESFGINADFSDAKLIGATFSGADLEEANLQNANLSLAKIERTSLRGADLRGATLGTMALADAILDEHTLLDTGRKEQLTQFKEEAEERDANGAGPSVKIPRVLAESVVSVSVPKRRDEVDDTPRTHQVMRVSTPISYITSSGNKQEVIFECAAIAMRRKQNSIPKLFDDLIAAPADDEQINRRDIKIGWLDLLTADWLAAEDKEACHSAIAKAMINEHAAPYFGSLEWLTADSLDVIRDGLEFCKEFGDGNAVIGALQAGASIFVFGIFPVGLYHTHKALGLLTNRLITADVQRDENILVAQRQKKILEDS